MLKFNFKRVMKARGIEKPYNYLRKQGYSNTGAYRIASDIGEEMNLKNVERLCELFKCTPNDLLEWTPNSPMSDIDNHPLKPLMRKNTMENLYRMLNSLPYEKLENIQSIIQDEIKK